MNAQRQLTRGTAGAALLDLDLWPEISTEGMDDAERQRVTRWHNVLSAYVRGAIVGPQLREEHLAWRQLLRLFNKCVEVAPDGRLAGWRGLLRNAGRKLYARSASIGNVNGASGALYQVFRKYPKIREYLVALVLKQPIPGHTHEARISNVQVHQEFLKRCKEAGIGAQEWPFIARWQGRRSIDRFIADVVAQNDARAVRARYGQIAAGKMYTGTGQNRILLARDPLDVIEMDAHRMDVIGVVDLPTLKGTLWIPIERLLILLICDAASGAALGYAVVIRRECSAEDILVAAVPMVKPWKQRQLDPGMEYTPGAGLPLGTITDLCPFGASILKVDNALINYSWAAIDRLAGRLGCTVNFGQVRKWMRRALIERLFGALEAAGFQRVVSTVGSNTIDPRRDHPVKAAVKHRVRLKLLLDLIDLEITRYNATASEGRFGLTPLESMSQIVDPHNTRTLFPVLPPTTALYPELDTLTFAAKITGSIERGRRPRIKFKRGLYTNPSIAQSPQLIGESVILHVHSDDIRTVKVFLAKSGASLGTATVGGMWAVQPHSLRFRKLVCDYIDDGRLKLDGSTDPVTALHRLLAREAASRHKPKAPKVSKAATILADEARATGVALDASTRRSEHKAASRPLSHRAPHFQPQVGGLRYGR